jgi:hypothetical protein
MWEITRGESASILEPHWHRDLDVKRPNRPTGFVAADFRGLKSRYALAFIESEFPRPGVVNITVV